MQYTMLEKYEKHEEMLVKHYNEVMDKVKECINDEESDSIEMTEFISALMDYASQLHKSIILIKYVIKRLDEKNRKEA